jgi:excisionase family DNA binding protein
MSTTPNDMPPPIAVTRREAAAMLGVSLDYFKDHVQPELRVIKRGRRMVRIPVAELERWARMNSAVQ